MHGLVGSAVAQALAGRPDRPSVTVMGLGYIGLPTAALLASKGFPVLGVDIRDDWVAALRDGTALLHEPGLAPLVERGLAMGLLQPSRTPGPSDVILICVPTPLDPERRPVLDMVFAALDAAAPQCAPGQLIVLESTVPVGTTFKLAERLAQLRPDLACPGLSAEPDIAIAYCPERALPGRVLAEIDHNSRCVGGLTPACAERARDFYAGFVSGAVTCTDVRTAELVKLAENAFRDTNIAFANELSMLCDQLEIDVREVIGLANRHPRVDILSPGPGVGGHCVAVDPWFAISAAPDTTRLMRMARDVNEAKTAHVLARVEAMLSRRPQARIACLGLAFKADIGDLRESPALAIVSRLAERHGERVRVVEPHIETLPGSLLDNGAALWALENALAASEIAVLLVDHAAFKAVPKPARAHLEILDTRGAWRDLTS